MSKEVVTIRISMRNNSDARKAGPKLNGVSVKHNGGKLLIATCPADLLDAFKEFLDGEHSVASYEMPQS